MELLVESQRQFHIGGSFHNHRWDFASLVLLGNLRELVYSVSDHGEHYFHHRYYARGQKEHYDVDFFGEAILACTGSRELSRGDVYCTPNDILHSIEVSGNTFAATLVLTCENVKWETNDLYAPTPLAPTLDAIPSPSLPPEIAETKLKELSSALGIQLS